MLGKEVVRTAAMAVRSSDWLGHWLFGASLSRWIVAFNK